ncbi:hypothetical protein U27_01195 [Candidatus Vecturithrix granuli]|uniref:Uncharacterized protein n=1 Tax=Vecturithrix granuli TaxID=1499967 RepID=A0A081C9P0_VECG1|nr:hypothetical protein U27_01195 [Candidatus Vecturithrix granuli]
MKRIKKWNGFEKEIRRILQFVVVLDIILTTIV